MSGLRGKVVVITGASSGIGAETAVQFARVGSKVVLTSRRESKLEETAEKCCQAGLDRNKILIIVADVLDDDDLQRIVDKTVDKFGCIDVLVNNAGNLCVNSFVTSTVNDVDSMYRIHVRSPYLLTKLALPHLVKQKGNVVNVSSLNSPKPFPGVFAYSVAKGAQDQFMKAAAMELGKDGVRFNSVCPGIIRTDIFVPGGMVEKSKLEDFYQHAATTHPAKRIGTPDEVAKVIVFLASDDASFVSAVNMPVDSGRYITTWE